MVRRAVLLLSWLCMTACSGTLAFGPEVPRPKERKPKVHQASQPKPEPALRLDGSNEAARTARPLQLSWEVQTEPFNRGLAVAPSGEVAVLSSGHIALYDGNSGGLLASKKACPTFEQSIGFVDGSTLAVVCDESVKLLVLPDLADKGLRALARTPRLVSFGKRRAAIAFEDGRVAVFDSGTWKRLRELTVDGPVSALDLSDDGRLLAVGLEGGDVVVVPPEGTSKRFTVKRALSVAALRFAPDGEQLFASSGPLAGLWTLAGSEVTRFKSVNGSWRARWVGPDAMASIGSDGLLLLDRKAEAVRSLGAWSESPLTGLAGSGDRLCAAERSGRLACFSRGGAGRSIAVGMQRMPAGAAVMAGRALTLKGQRLTLLPLVGDRLPEPSEDVVIYRYAERTVAQVRQARWSEAARAKVVKIADGVVHLRLAAGVDGDPLQPDEPIRLSW